jgi:hypothetical protein
VIVKGDFLYQPLSGHHIRRQIETAPVWFDRRSLITTLFRDLAGLDTRKVALPAAGQSAWLAGGGRNFGSVSGGTIVKDIDGSHFVNGGKL